MQPKPLTLEDKVRVGVIIVVIAILLAGIWFNGRDGLWPPLSTGPVPKERQYHPKIVAFAFENYDPVKGQAELRKEQAERDRQVAAEKKATAHRGRVWAWFWWIGGLSLIAFLVIWQIRLCKANYQPPAASRPAPNISPKTLWVAAIWIVLILAAVLAGKWILLIIPAPATIILLVARRCQPTPPTP